MIPTNMRKLMRARKAISARILSTESLDIIHSSRLELSQVEAAIQSSLEHRRTKAEDEAASKMVSDPQYFYQYAKKFAKVRAEIGPILFKGSYTSDQSSMAGMAEAHSDQN